MTEPDWVLTPSTRAGLQFAEWLVINNGSHLNFTDQYGTDTDTAWAAAEHRGWIRTEHPDPRAPRRLGDTREARPVLTGAGRAERERVQNLRTNAVARTAACRQALLLFLYGPGRGIAGTDKVTEKGLYEFYATPFTNEEVADAVAYLADKTLITGIKTWGPVLARPALTAAGIDCVENNNGNVRDYLSDATGGSVTYSQTFNAPVSGQVAQGQTVRQTQTQGIDPETLKAILSEVFAATADLDDLGDRQDVEEVLEEVRAAALSGSPQEVEQRIMKLRRLGSRLGSSVFDAATTAATTAIMMQFGLG